MAKEIDPQVDEGTEQPATEETENEVDDSSASADDELADRLRGLEARLSRSEQENETLRESVRLQSRLVEQATTQRTQSPGNELSAELRELGKAINPLLSEQVNAVTQPLINTVSRLYDQNDAVAFQLALQKEDAELMKGETFDKINQTVESIRRRAANETGAWLSRQDAYHYAKGSGMLKLDKKPAKTANATTDADEVKRKQQVARANATGSNRDSRSENKINAEVQAVREKAHRGERLTDKERAIFANFLGNTAI